MKTYDNKECIIGKSIETTQISKDVKLFMVDKRLSLPNISVVVCTRNRVESLKKCLDSLLSLDYPLSDYEIVVVDNNSADTTKEFLQSNYNKIKYVFESHVGIPYARNAGVKHATGSIIAFIDDDCMPDKNWLKELIKGFKSDTIIGVGGPTYPPKKNVSKKKVVDPILGTFDGGTKERYINYVGTGNSAFKREAFSLTLFDVNLKRFEDVLFCLTLGQLGYKILYMPSAIIYALTPSNRFGIKPIIQRGFSDGFSYAYLNLQIRNWSRCLAFLIINHISCLIHFFWKRDYGSLYCILRDISAFLAIPKAIGLRKSPKYGKNIIKLKSLNNCFQLFKEFK